MKNPTFGVHFVLRKNKINNNLAPIYVRITVDSIRSELSIKRRIQVSNWNTGKGLAKPTSPENKQLNSYLEHIRRMIVEAYQDLAISKQIITAETIKNKYLGVEEPDMTLCKLIEFHNTNSKEILRWGTLKNYFATQKYIQLFLKENYHVSDIHLSELRYKFLMEFEHFLRIYSPTDHDAPMGNNTVMKHIERLKKMIKMAIRYEWLEKDPFAAFKQKFYRVERGFLTEEELSILETIKFENPRLQYAKDLFVFACYTGLTYIDVMSLTPDNLQPGIDKQLWLITSRIKTDTPVKIPILPVAMNLIEKYLDDPRAQFKNKLFPNICNQALNRNLKEVAESCKIKKNLTFHLARHTFATTVTLTNGVPIESVSQMLGHTKISTTQIYAKVVEKKLSEDMDKLKRKLAKKKSKQDC